MKPVASRPGSAYAAYEYRPGQCSAQSSTTETWTTHGQRRTADVGHPSGRATRPWLVDIPAWVVRQALSTWIHLSL